MTTPPLALHVLVGVVLTLGGAAVMMLRHGLAGLLFELNGGRRLAGSGKRHMHLVSGLTVFVLGTGFLVMGLAMLMQLVIAA